MYAFDKNMLKLKVLGVQSNSVSDTVCNVNYSLKYGMSQSALFGCVGRNFNHVS